MTKKRDYIEEILLKKKRLHKKANRIKQFQKRVHPLVRGFRATMNLDRSVDYRSEWLKYGAIGYIACLEGYFRLLVADLINAGDPYLTNLTDYKDIKFGIEHIVAIKKEKISLGDYVSHLMSFNSVSDINYNLSIVLGRDYFELFNSSKTSLWNLKPIGEQFPDTIGNTQKLFELRHLYAHELATKERVKVRDIENYISSAALLVTGTEEIITSDYLVNGNA